MADEQTQTLAVDAPAPPRHPGGKFQPGHPRYGGRKPGTVNKKIKKAQEIAAHMKVDPVAFMLELVNNESVEVTELDKKGNAVLDPDTGKPRRVKQYIPLDMRLDAAKAVAPYVHARLQATQVTGADDGPVQVDLPTQEILADPKLSGPLQDLALLVATQAAQAEDNSVN